MVKTTVSFGRLKPNFQAYLDELKRGLVTEVGGELADGCAGMVDDWSDPPKFPAEEVATAQGFGVYVGPVGDMADVWGFQSGGTRYIDAQEFEKQVVAERLPRIYRLLSDINRRGLRRALQGATRP